MVPRLILFLAVLFFWACSEAPKPATTEAVNLTALDSLNDQIVEDPNNKELYFERAKILYQDSGDMESAMADLDLITEMDSSEPRSYYYRALWKLDRGAVKEAHDNVKKAVEIQPDHLESRLLLSRIFLFVQNYEESIKEANEALKIDVYNAEAYFLKGLSFKEAGDSSKAVSSFLTASEQDPEFYEAWMQLGLLFGVANDPNTEFYYDNALRIRPESMEALYNQAVYFQNNDRFDEAASNYRRMALIDSIDTRSFYNRGYIHLVHEENFDSAAYYFNKTLLLNPKHVNARYNLGLSFELKGKADSAVHHYRKALELIPNHDLSARGLERILG